MDVLEKAHELERQGIDIIHLEVGEPDFNTPDCVKAAACKALDEGHTHYTHSLGLLELRVAICQYYAKHYGVSIDPEGRRLAFHVTGGKYEGQAADTRYRPGPYAINVCDTAGQHRVVVAGQPGHLYFGPVWSPDGAWLVYLDCHAEEDPAHFAADLCIGRPDGSEHRVVTQGQRHWFGAAYGTAEARGGGSNTSLWSPDGSTVTYTRIVPGSHPDCEYHPERPDHQELVYRPTLHVVRG